MKWIACFYTQILRKKPIPKDILDTQLTRCLTSLDLTLVALGTMLGASVYTLAGEVARLYSGPAVFISFLMAAILCALNMVCYAEFGTKLPKVGAFYEFNYIIYGEFVAFITGWCGIFQVSLSSAYVARICSGAVDSLFNKTMENLTMRLLDNVTMNHYPDLLGVSIVLIATVVVSLGPRTSSMVNTTLTTLTLFCITVITCAGFSQLNISNWTNYSLLPYGVWGIINGSARCFFGFLGFACLFSLSEEAINPQKNIVQSLITVCCVATSFYVISSISLTLMVPYTELDVTAPFFQALISVDLKPIAYLVSIGTIVSSATALNGCVNTVSRYAYAMASDGLLLPALSTVNFHTKTPLTATVCSGILIALLTLLLDIETLIQLVVMDSLLFFIFLAAAVLVMRYSLPENCPFPLKYVGLAPNHDFIETNSTSLTEFSALIDRTRQNLADIGKIKQRYSNNVILNKVTKLCEPCHLPNICTFFLCFCFIFLGFYTNFAKNFVTTGTWIAVVGLSLLCGICFLCVIVLATFQENNSLSNTQVCLHIL